MRGYWIHHPRKSRWAPSKCGWYNPYVGYKSTPNRVDVRCRRCGARVQFNPQKKYEKRGKHRQAIFIHKPKWTNDEIVEHCLVENNIIQDFDLTNASGFVTASELMKNKSDSKRGDK